MVYVDENIFQWAKNVTKKLEELPLINLTELEKYHDELGCHRSLYHDIVTGETLYCKYIYKDNDDDGLLYWQKVKNFDAIKKDHQELTNILLRNGAYLCTRITGGRDLKTVSFSYVKKKNKKSPGSH